MRKNNYEQKLKEQMRIVKKRMKELEKNGYVEAAGEILLEEINKTLRKGVNKKEYEKINEMIKKYLKASSEALKLKRKLSKAIDFEKEKVYLPIPF
jgi:LytS/YehU family sensor histidine kinase